MAEPIFRLSETCRVFYRASQFEREFLATRLLRGSRVGVDLSAFDAVNLESYLDESDPTILDVIPGTVLTAQSDLYKGVAARVRFQGAFNTLRPTMRLKVVGVAGGSRRILHAPWPSQVSEGGN